MYEKKLFKKVLSVTVLSISLLLMSVTGYAEESADQDGHVLTPNVDSNGSVVSLRSSQSTAKGSNCSIKWVDPNEDDKVYAYRGSFKGRTLVNVYPYKIYIEGNIESAGDPVAELYVKGSIKKISGDPMVGIPQFYKYKITLK